MAAIAYVAASVTKSVQNHQKYAGGWSQRAIGQPKPVTGVKLSAGNISFTRKRAPRFCIGRPVLAEQLFENLTQTVP